MVAQIVLVAFFDSYYNGFYINYKRRSKNPKVWEQLRKDANMLKEYYPFPFCTTLIDELVAEWERQDGISTFNLNNKWKNHSLELKEFMLEYYKLVKESFICDTTHLLLQADELVNRYKSTYTLNVVSALIEEKLLRIRTESHMKTNIA